MRGSRLTVILAILISLAVLGTGVYRWLNPPPSTFASLYGGEPASVRRLLMRDGTTGEAVTTTDPETIVAFFDLAGSAIYTHRWNLRPRAGWLYYIDLFEIESEVPDFRITFLGSRAEVGRATYDLSRDLSTDLETFYHHAIQGDDA